MPNFFKSLNLLGLIFLGLSLAGCASTETDPYEGMPAEKIYTIGKQAMDNESYYRARGAFESLNAQYPFESFSEQADLDLIYADYASGESALALAQAARFLRVYPASKHVDYAYYMIGVIDFENGRSFIQRYFPYNMSEHDAVNYHNAYASFYKIVTTYPNSPYAPDARRRMLYLRNTLAQFEMNTAEFYYTRGAYLAALDRAKIVFLHYPHAPQVKAAMTMMANCYDKLSLPKPAENMRKAIEINSKKA